MIEMKFNLAETLERINRKVIYLTVAVAVALPIIVNFYVPPAEIPTANLLFDVIEKLPQNTNQIVLFSTDWGPGTSAENLPQTEAVIEHLLRRKIPFALITNYAYGTPFMKSVPEAVVKKLKAEDPSKDYIYGKDWVNLGFRPGGGVFLQGLARSTNWHEMLIADERGTPLKDIPAFAAVKSIKNVALLVEVTGLVGVFGNWIQYFQSAEYRPPFVHGCTSITIPEAHNYLASGQIVGLLEGGAGAAWYENLLNKGYPQRTIGTALKVNTSLAVAHLVIIFFIFCANFGVISTIVKKILPNPKGVSA
ncbi:hypothetical protein JNK13_02405 [bacterium]|nr:hypothetical protein [bacterium]